MTDRTPHYHVIMQGAEVVYSETVFVSAERAEMVARRLRELRPDAWVTIKGCSREECPPAE